MELNKNSIVLETFEKQKLESLDTLVYTSSLFVIPVNIAAYNGKFLLMNIYIFIALTSWAHHSCRHMKVQKCIYDEIDKLACIASFVYLLMYTLFYTTFRKFFFTFLGCMCILILYYRVTKNRILNWDKRGIKNWKYQKPHILMHMTATLVGAYVALN